LKQLAAILFLVLSTSLVAQNPGGVAPTTWYKASVGVSNTTDGAQTYSWNNQASGSNNCYVGGGSLFYQNNAAQNINFNPTISFNNSSYFATGRLPITFGNFTIVGVGIRKDNGQNILVGDNSNNGNDQTFTFGYTGNTNLQTNFGGTQSLNSTVSSFNSPVESPFLIGLLFNSSVGRVHKEFRNNSMTIGSDTRTTTLGGYSNMRIGSSITAGTDHFNGNISEVIVFNSVLTGLQELQVYSYLAVKYGIMLSNNEDGDGTINEVISGLVREGDVVASDGSTIIWNYALQTGTYFNDVAGIGRDDNSALSQKQSKSAGSAGMVTIGLGSIATTNSANANTFSADKSFLMWGHNAGTNAFTTTGAPSGREVLGRKWRVQETGTVGNVRIQIPASTSSSTTKLPAAGSLDLLVDDDGDFTSGAVVYPMTLVGTNWEATVNFTTGQFFTVTPGLAQFEVTTQGSEAGPVNIVFTLTLPSTNTTGSAFTFDINDNGTGSAIAGLDYNAIPGTAKMSVPNGSLTGTYTVTVIDDAVIEAIETISLSLSNPSSAAFSIDPSNVAIASIYDDDGGPGGVRTNLNVWLKADLGAGSTDNTDVTNWVDQSFLGHNGTSDGNPPSYRNNATDNINYNPGVVFDGSNDRLVLDLTDIKDGNGNGNGRFAIFGVGQRTDGGNNLVIGSPDYDYNRKVHFGYLADGTVNFENNASLSFSTNGFNNPAISPFSLFVSSSNAGRTLEERRDGVFRRNANTYTGKIQTGSSNFIGALPQATAYYQGVMNEIIVFENVLSDLDKLRVHSYLALKYGLHLGADNNGNATLNEVINASVREGDYVASNGTTVFWNYASQTATYYNGVAGLGRDDASALLQKQTKSVMQDALVTMALDSIYATNAENPSNFSSDFSFLMWGNNQGALSFSATGAPTNKTILGRVWRVQETGSVGSVFVRVPASTSSATTKLPFTNQSLQLFQDADGDFTSGSVGTTLTLNGTNWEGRVDFANGEYFSFGESPAEAVLTKTVNGEENGPVSMVFTVTLSVPNTTGSTITFDFDDLGTGTATSGSDYVAVAGGAQISILNGASTGSISVVVIDDALSEVVETFNAQISNPSTAAVFIGTSTATASILDNDNGPAGITNNLRLWLKPDAGTSTTANNTFLNTWFDQSGNGNDAVQDGTPPAYLNNTSSNLNFQPTVDFDGADDRLVVDLTTLRNTSYALFVVGVRDNASTNYAIGSEGGNKDSDLYLGYTNDVTATLSQWNNDLDLTVNAYNSPALSPYVLMGSLGAAERTLEELRDGGFVQAQNTSLTQLKGTKTNYIGDLESVGNYEGRISEVIAYSTDLTVAERQKIYTYLGLKYGLQLPVDNNANAVANEVLSGVIREGDYVSSNNTVIWDYAGVGSTYFNNVAGIGRDDLGGLNQKQSKSQLSNALLTVGLTNIAANNASNTNTFSANQSFMLWGHNNGALTFSATGAPVSREIVGRIWRIEETGTVGTVKISVPASTSALATKLPAAGIVELLVSNSTNFSSPTNSVNMSLVGTNWEATVDLVDGDFITFAKVIITAGLSQQTQGAESGPTSVEMRVTLSTTNNTGAAITFDFDDVGTGTAASGSDYTAVLANAKISVPNGSATGAILIPVLDDALVEGTETIDFQISNPSNGAVVITQATALGEILDNDTPPITEAPGGVSDQLIFWLKADAGTSTTTNGAVVSTWSDQTPNGLDATNNGTGPLYVTIGTNYNPTLDFSNSTSGGYRITNDPDINTSNSTAKSYTIAFTTGANVTSRQLIYEQGGGTNGLNLYINSGSLVSNIWNNSNDNAISTVIAANSTYVVTFVFDGSVQTTYMYVNGSLAGTDGSVFSSLNSHTGAIGLGKIVSSTQYNGQIDVTANEGFLGSIMEMAYYNEKVLSATERAQVEGYMGIKYGVSIAHDYLASDALTTLWSTTANTGFNNRVSGIGRDDDAQLDQRQSRNTADAGLLSIGLGGVAASNALNATAFSSNKAFVLWGDNGRALTGVESNGVLTPQSGDVDRVKRKWKIVETNTVGSTRLVWNKASVDAAFPNSALGGLALKVADDTALTTNPVYYTLTEATVNSVASYVADINLSGTRYFSLVQRGFMLWNGAEWRGGLSSANNHHPSDDPLDAAKDLYVQAGDSALTEEAVSVANLTINASADLLVGAGQCLHVAGSFTNNGGFVLLANSSGYAQYTGPATTGTFEQYIENEGWHLIASPFSNTTFADLQFKDDNGFINHPFGGVSLDSCSYCNLWQYDPSANSGSNIGFGVSNAFGTWRSSASSAQAFTSPGGWNLYLDEASGFSVAPWTLSLTGTFNTGDIDQSVNENNGGWNLLANPYPSTLNWDDIQPGLAAAGIANGVHIWDEANGNFAVYASGAGTNGLTPYIAPFQGFYVQTAVEGAAGSGDVLHTFSLTNADRPDACPPNSAPHYKTAADNEQLLLQTTHLSSGKKDQLYVLLAPENQRGFDHTEDVRKLFSGYKDSPLLYAVAGRNRVAINAMPQPVDRDSVLLGLQVANQSPVEIALLTSVPGYTVFLEDIKTGQWYALEEGPLTFEHDEHFRTRFWLHFGPRAFNPTKWTADKPFYVYQEAGMLVLKTRKSVQNGSWYLATPNGGILKQGAVNLSTGQTQHISTEELAQGVYVFVLLDKGVKYAEKIVLVK
jgi:hypothetical protein